MSYRNYYETQLSIRLRKAGLDSSYNHRAHETIFGFEYNGVYYSVVLKSRYVYVYAHNELIYKYHYEDFKKIILSQDIN